MIVSYAGTVASRAQLRATKKSQASNGQKKAWRDCGVYLFGVSVAIDSGWAGIRPLTLHERKGRNVKDTSTNQTRQLRLISMIAPINGIIRRCGEAYRRLREEI
jgi:hypothetical protein